MRQLGAFEVKTHLSQILDDVQRGETILITKRGEPVARLVPNEPLPQDVKSLLADFRKWRQTITWNEGEGISIETARRQGRK